MVTEIWASLAFKSCMVLAKSLFNFKLNCLRRVLGQISCTLYFMDSYNSLIKLYGNCTYVCTFGGTGHFP